MIINYFAIVNLSAQIENFTTQNTKCLAKNLQRINTMCFTDSTCIVYPDKKSIYHLFLILPSLPTYQNCLDMVTTARLLLIQEDI